ncbi:Putative anti-sigma factor antagonist [Streptomyces sp. YIM 121038]|uniref:anti-sigma factor antagonist n=1 Tax=Streptomyces sp. YIM 121038 TaxID=2136401 RepID=UPI0011107CB0|nr:anti-sigma factor antagonist [Streptomyces sp. YIM 121038]QCX81872.1 Putative anti-sigma factor antagonist [Streptomyces sp. YIM 121038]
MPQAAQSGTGQADSRAGLADPRGPAPRSELTVRLRAEGDRLVVTVRGDLDLDTEQELRRELRSALARSGEGIDVDLSGVAFCDCSGLNTLLTVRQRALDEAKTVAILALSPAAERVFALTGALPLFTPEASAQAGAPSAADGPDDSENGLRVKIAQLRRAMQTRGPIDTARGILMAAFALDEEEAWDVLVMTSQNTNVKLYLLAQQVVGSIKGAPLPDATQAQLSAAVTHVTAVHGRAGRGE